MFVHPDAQKFLDITAGSPPLDTQTAEQNRADLSQAIPLTGMRAEMHSVQNTTIAGVPVRVYIPVDSSEPLPCMVYFHGGGWVMGDPELSDATVREIVADAGIIGISVDYPLAPENPFPAAFNAAISVVTAILDGESGINLNTEKVAVAGDSAGGNIAAVTAQQMRGHSPTLVHQALIFPVVDVAGMDTESYSTFAEGYYLTARDMAYFADQYCGNADRTDPHLSPLRNEDLNNLPSATVVVAECDPLVSEAKAYAQAMLQAGNQVSVAEFMGQVHPFIHLGEIIQDAHVARRLIGRQLKFAFESA